MKAMILKSRLLLAFLAIFIGISLFSGCTIQNTNTEPIQEAQTSKPLETVKPSNTPKNQVSDGKTSMPKYEIVYELKGKRFDKGVNYYVLIPKVDLSNNNYQEDIKIIIKKIVEEKGSKISIDFFDTKEALELLYKLYGDMSLGRTATKEENEMLAEHAIAGFSGKLTTDIYLNSLYFFPSATVDNKKMGKYVDTMEFNPNDYNP